MIKNFNKDSASIEAATDRGKLKVYERIRKVVEHTKKFTQPLHSETGEILHGRNAQFVIWVWDFFSSFLTQNIVTNALNHMNSLSTMDDQNFESTMEEIS